jgi:hypothetical protein
MLSAGDVRQIGHDLTGRAEWLPGARGRSGWRSSGRWRPILGCLGDVGDRQWTTVRGASLRGVDQRQPGGLLRIRPIGHYENSLLSCDISLITIIIPYEVSASRNLYIDWRDV